VWFAHRLRGAVLAAVVTVALLLAPTAYSVQTAATAHEGALPTAGPASTVRFGAGMPSGQAGPPFGGSPAGMPPEVPGTFGRPGPFASPGSSSGFPASPGGPTSGTHGAFGGPGGRPGGAPGGLGGASQVSAALRSVLTADAGRYRWVAATTSSNTAASLELATGKPVMSLGGFNGTDPAITLAAFQKLVAAGEVHYYVADGQGFIGSTPAGSSDAYRIQQWVEHHFAAKTIGGQTVYDLTS
jgi:hypothetical protein